MPRLAYRHHAARQRNPELRSARAKRNEMLMAHLERVWQANLKVYGAKKVWKRMNRKGIAVDRCSVEQLMRRLGLAGVVRARPFAPRRLIPQHPARWIGSIVSSMPINQLWVLDFTYVSTWQGCLYVAFVVDVFTRRIVGWRVSTTMITGFVLDALEQELYERQPSSLDALIHHSDRGSQYVSIRYSTAPEPFSKESLPKHPTEFTPCGLTMTR